jgi:glycosyltransferase involved in cell wall biosynthesis
VAAGLAPAMLRRSAAGKLPAWARRFPHQVTLVARCLTEAGAVRTSRRLAGPGTVIVILTASEALHEMAALLGGPHLRFVHEIVTTEDAIIRWAGRAAGHGTRRACVLVPTEAVGAALAARFPRLTCQVRPFAVAAPGDRLTDAERRAARRRHGIADERLAVCLVGGWWPYKDMTVVDAALSRAGTQVSLLVAGTPADQEVLRRWHAIPGLYVHALAGPASEHDLREVYAAASITLVARQPGTGKESGLVTDAARLGVPLLVSGHDPALTACLAGQDWVRVFTAGSASSLATALRELAARPLPRPGPDAAAAIGVPTAAEQAAFLISARLGLEARR